MKKFHLAYKSQRIFHPIFVHTEIEYVKMVDAIDILTCASV